jgi:hypothetical protein
MKLVRCTACGYARWFPETVVLAIKRGRSHCVLCGADDSLEVVDE